MMLRRVECRQFRCLCETAFMPEAGINVIRGNNAQGKTSLLEAILFATTSRSHRTSRESDLVRHGETRFRVVVEGECRERQVVIEATWSDGAKRFKINGAPQERVSDILGKLNVVLFSPEDLVLVKGSATYRRRFLDIALSQLYPAYLNSLQQYRQVLRQRNELLRGKHLDRALLDVWDTQLAQHGPVLLGYRCAFLGDLATFASGIYEELTGGETLDVRYRPDVPPGACFKTILNDSLASDVRRVLTSRGPHRDEVEFLVAECDARPYASQGQQKTAALALKLAEVELFKRRTGEYPILALDEVLSELDEKRAQRLLDAIKPEVQCLLTTTILEDRAILSGSRQKHFIIERGRLEAQ